MSESEVSQIRDEDVLRRMWQQTEDFSRKKEIRAHMYRLREERLRNLYSPEPTSDGKGCEFTSAQGHVKSFADQTFQSMKSKEVRDAGSPPKEFTYRGQDLKELSNAGWNVESEDRTADDGRTHVKSVNANIEGRYDVEGGRGQFAAVDRQRHAVTEQGDDNSSLRRDETSSDTAAHEHVVRQTDDGTRISSTTSSSNTSSKIQQVSSTKHETVPYVTDDDYDLRRLTSQQTDLNDRVTRITNRNDNRQTSRGNDFDNAELVSRKVEYPDRNTKVIVETRCLPDGTRVTSTRREFHAPAAHSARSDSYQSRSQTDSYSSHHNTDTRDSTSKVTRHTSDTRTDDIVDSQRNVDDSDFKRQIRQYTVRDDDDYSNQRHVSTINKKVSDYSQTEDSKRSYETRTHMKTTDQSTTKRDDYSQSQRRIVDDRNDNRVDETDRRQLIRSRDHDIQHNVVREIQQIDDTNERTHNITVDRKNTAVNVRDTTTRDKTDTEDIRKISKDEIFLSERIREVPKNRNEAPQTPRETTRDGQVPSDIYRDIPKNTDVHAHDIPRVKKITEERVLNVTNDAKKNVEEVVERKTTSDHYQTTYQNDFQTRKVSTDLSPTHQAWASTLRSDTPSTTRPSTRASSPGSKTFKSSTSSLRSSVSPDKTSRKPSSRGGSPNKIDRYSPTRTITSDRYSSTHSTQSINEIRTTKTTSPERKPPSGRSPGRPGYSPDRKPQDTNRQRLSTSPEKKPQSFGDRPYSSRSPERKPYKSIPADRHPEDISPTGKGDTPKSSSPTRATISDKPGSKLSSSSPRSSVSPDRKPGYEKSSTPRPSSSPDKKPKQGTEYARSTSPSTKPSERTPSHTKPSESDILVDAPAERHPESTNTKRPSVSPDRKPGYMRPTAASHPVTSNKSPQPTRHVPAQSLDHKLTSDDDLTTKIKEDHYRFVDEETKMYTQIDTTNTNGKVTMTTTHDSSLTDKTRGNDVQSEDSTDFSISPTKDDKPPSQKETIVITENDDLYGRVDKTFAIITSTNQDKQSEDITTLKNKPKSTESPKERDVPSREASPTKYGTYEKKKQREVNTKDVTIVRETTDSKDVKNDSLTRRKKTTAVDLPSSPTKKGPREITSPVKSPTNDKKYKHTTDFITTEKKIEEINKKTTSKDHPRQLITPSSSPTRKPKPTETEPSTGQSSPTTSVSGFVYFSSPRRPEVTDLDEIYLDTENLEEARRPDTLDIKRSPSPSKIPCRSPSPEKHVPTTKDSLPRKSSLKKPSTDVSLASPIEKPPTNFRVSPIEDKPGLPEHKVIKKDHPHEAETGESKTSEASSVKPKPPLQRRETYEDRCKKILGMVDDTKTTESITKETTRYTKKTRPPQSSPSVSPCESPVPKDSSQFSEFSSKKRSIDTKVDVTDFISKEQEHVINTSITRETKPKTSSRESSPTKLQHITSKTSSTINKTDEVDEDTATITGKTKSRQSPEKSYPNDKIHKRPSQSPERKQNVDGPKDSSSTKPSHPSKSSPTRTSLSPERRYPKERSMERQSPDKTSVYSKTTTTVTSQNYDKKTRDDVQEMTRITKTTQKSQPTRVLESPTRQIPKSDQDLPEKLTKQSRTTSPSKSLSKNKSPDRNREPRCEQVKRDELSPGRDSPKRPEVSENIPGYMKSTAAITSKFESTTIGDVKESHTMSPVNKREPSPVSATRQSLQDKPRATSPTKSTQVFESSPRRPNSSPQRKPLKDSVTPEVTAKHSRTSSPIKQSRPSNSSPERKPDKKEPSSQPKRPSDSSPTRLQHVDTPGYMKSTITSTSKLDTTNYDSEYVYETITSHETVEKRTPSPKSSKSPTRQGQKSTDESCELHRTNSPVRERPTQPSYTTRKQDLSPDRKPIDTHPSKSINKESPADMPSQIPRSPSPTKTPGYMKTTTSVAYKFDLNITDIEEPTTPEIEDVIPVSEHSPESPDIPNYMKPTASVISKYDTFSTISQDTHDVDQKQKSPKRTLASPTRDLPEREAKDQYLTKPEDTRQLRTPSPVKKATKITEISSDFILSEREQEILNKVQKSLRKLSPERKEKSPSRERSPTKSTTSLQDLDITTTETVGTNKLTNRNLSEITEEKIAKTSDVTRTGKQKQPTDNKTPIKPSSRTVSPIKKAPTTVLGKADKSPESLTKSRSISPKKPLSHVERPQSPQVPKSSGIKPRDQIPAHLTRKPTPATLATTKIERVYSEVKKTNGVTKQNVLNKATTTKTVSKSVTSPTGKVSELEPKRMPTHKGVKDNVSPKKEVITRTTSEITMKSKKTSPQRIKSKPEIQVSDMCTKTPKSQKPIIKEPYTKLPNKPKSATALNTSTDEDDVIIDVQQSKSSRENSPDRICPTPINFADDVSTPRFPDEVSEPDDDFVKRTHNIIHETETVVDDIVEICEDEELFVKKPAGDDSLLSVNEKVNKFTNKIRSASKPKDSTTVFKDTEKRVHSDFTEDNLKSDECLLTVSEKVTKFAKGPREMKDNRSPSRKITDEFDKDTVYQDDYTKLSVNDKAHLFVETAENVKITKVKPIQKVERPDLTNVDESLKSDDCLLSVSDKVSKFVKTAENIFTDTQVTENTEKKIIDQYQKFNRQITEDDEDDNETFDRHEIINPQPESRVRHDNKSSPLLKEPKSSQPKVKDSPTERTPTVKITTLRSSEAVKKAKALFENIASTQKTNETSYTTKSSTKLTDIGVIKKSPKTDSTTALHPSKEDTPCVTDVDSEADVPQATRGRPSSRTPTKSPYIHTDERPRSSPNRLAAGSPEVPRSKSPMTKTVEVTTTKTVLSRYPASRREESPRNRPESPMQRTESPRQRTESPRQRTESPRHRPESDKSDKVPGYLRPTMTSQIKEEPKIVEELEVSSRRGSGKFGVELRRTSVDRSTVSSERRRSIEHHQPCIEDIFDLDLLEQMLEKVTGYEQRRRIRAQIRVARNQSVDSNTFTRTTKTTTTITKTRSPERTPAKSPERLSKSAPQKTSSPDRRGRSTPQKVSDRSHQKEFTPVTNGHAKEPAKIPTTRQRPRSPEKPAQKSTLAPKTPTRQSSPDKKRPTSPSKTVSKPKSNRFNEYASAYMKKVGLNESDKVKFTDVKTRKTTEAKQTVKQQNEQIVHELTTKTVHERTSSRDVTEIVQNGKRLPSPGRRQSPDRKVQISDKVQSLDRKAHSPSRKASSPERHVQSPDRLYQRTPSPDFKRPKAETVSEAIVKTVYDVDKKIPSKQAQEEKPSWVTSRNLKKITSESRTYSTKKIENEKPKYRAASPSKVITKPTDVITSSYGPGPLDADGRPLFGIKALRNGATNVQVKGTVIRQEFHSRNGGEPEGTVSVTAYSSQPEDLEQLLAAQGVEAPSRLHGLSAITTTKKFGGDTGHSISNVHTKEDRASLEHFTHTDRKTDSRVDNLQTRTYDRMEHVADTNRAHSKQTERNDRTVKREEKSTEVKRGKIEERRERVEKREDKKTVRQSSVKSLTEKYIKSTNESGKSDRTIYPKAGLILRTTSMRDSVSSDDANPGLTRADSEHSVGSGEDTVVTTTQRTGNGVRTTTTRTTHGGTNGPTVTQTRTSTVHEPIVTKKTTMLLAQEPLITKKTSYVTHEPGKVTQTRQGTTTVTTERSFLDSNSKVTGVQDILTRMKNADIVIQEGDTVEDSEARALLNKFLGATVLMAGMQGYVADQPDGRLTVKQETIRSTGSGGKVTSTRSIEEFDVDHCWDERLLKKLLDECTDYEQRRRLRARIRTLMAEQEACASAVTEALGAAGVTDGESGDAREEEEVTVTSSVRRDSSDKTVSSSTTTTKTSKVIEMTRSAPKPVSPFAKFRQLEKQNSTNSPNSPKSPQSPGSPSQPYFKFTDPALQCSALTIKERLLQWCRDKTRDYENVKLENFSTSWADGLAFCALVHHFLPQTFDYSKLTPERRRHNFTLAFKVADEKAGIYPLLDVDDMVAMRKPDWKCVFTYVQAIYRRFKDQD